MKDYIMCAIDEHEASYTIAICHNDEEPMVRNLRGGSKGRRDMIVSMKRKAGQFPGAKLVAVYEASYRGFALYGDLTEAGIKCFVLPPTGVSKSLKDKCAKNDKHDTRQTLELLRGHLLAGNKMPHVRVPDAQVRDDRELVRARIDLSNKRTRIKNHVVYSAGLSTEKGTAVVRAGGMPTSQPRAAGPHDSEGAQ